MNVHTQLTRDTLRRHATQRERAAYYLRKAGVARRARMFSLALVLVAFAREAREA